MKLGLFGINMGGLADPESMARVALAAEEAGFESVWTGEHLVAETLNTRTLGRAGLGGVAIEEPGHGDQFGHPGIPHGPVAIEVSYIAKGSANSETLPRPG